MEVVEHKVEVIQVPIQHLVVQVAAVWAELAELVPGLQLPQMSLAPSKDKKIYAQRLNNANERFGGLDIATGVLGGLQTGLSVGRTTGAFNR